MIGGGGTGRAPVDADGGAHPDHPDQSRLVGIAREAAENLGFPDHPDRSRPETAIPPAASRPLRDLCAAWRARWAREDRAADGDAAEAAERAAMAAHYAAPADAGAYRPGDPDPLRDGLLRGCRAQRR